MPRNVTMDDLVTACSQQVDLENHTVISRAEWQRFISRAYGELWTIVFESGMQYFETLQSFTTAGLSYLAEPGNTLSVVSLSYVNGTSYYDLRALQPQERSRASRISGTSSDRARFYAHVDDRIYLYPTPPTGQTYELRYVPQSPDLTTYDGDTCVDVVDGNGHDFIIWGVAVRACGKTESDPQLAMRERAEARDRFMDSVRLRAMTAPRRIMVEDEDVEDSSW